jgi:hypothetical protein
MTDARYDYALGIDPGTSTGVALALPEPEALGYRWAELQTLPLHRALAYVQDHVLRLATEPGCARVLVVVEDARLISGPAHQKLGAGSIRRDCKVWEELLADLGAELDGLRIIFVKPTRGGLRKLTAEQLATYTGCQLKGSQHARDAAGLLFPHL